MKFAITVILSLLSGFSFAQMKKIEIKEYGVELEIPSRLDKCRQNEWSTICDILTAAYPYVDDYYAVFYKVPQNCSDNYENKKSVFDKDGNFKFRYFEKSLSENAPEIIVEFFNDTCWYALHLRYPKSKLVDGRLLNNKEVEYIINSVRFLSSEKKIQKWKIPVRQNYSLKIDSLTF